MRIAFVHPALMDYRLELFNELNKKYDITFIFTHQGRGQDGVKEKHLRIPSDWNYNIITNETLKIKGRGIFLYLKLVKELLYNRYDIILTSTSWYICYPIARITGKKFILLTENWYWSSNSISRKILNLATRYIARKADSIIAMGTKSYEGHLNFGIDSRKIFKCVQCSIDYSKLPAKDIRNELKLGTKKIILYLSRIVKRKGLDYLIRAFAHLEKNNDVILLIVGDGPFRKECEYLIKELEINNVVFTGYVEDKVSYYSSCDIFVLPTIIDNPEPWGLVINESMSFGKPIVSTDAVGASYDLISEGNNGYIVENKNVKKLYDALNKIITNQELARKMGENSREIFENKNRYNEMFSTFVRAINYVNNRKNF